MALSVPSAKSLKVRVSDWAFFAAPPTESEEIFEPLPLVESIKPVKIPKTTAVIAIPKISRMGFSKTVTGLVIFSSINI